MHLPPEFVEKVHRIFGDCGRRWLPGLPGIVARCREKWGLCEGAVCPNMSMNYIEIVLHRQLNGRCCISVNLCVHVTAIVT